MRTRHHRQEIVGRDVLHHGDRIGRIRVQCSAALCPVAPICPRSKRVSRRQVLEHGTLGAAPGAYRLSILTLAQTGRSLRNAHSFCKLPDTTEKLPAEDGNTVPEGSVTRPSRKRFHCSAK